MNHGIERDVHDEYMSVPAMFDQLRAATDKLSMYMLLHMGSDAERALAQLLQADISGARPRERTNHPAQHSAA
jgi:hypothetical protein